MWKRIALSTVLLFIVWFAMDIVIHGLVLGSEYAKLPQLFRAQDEMRPGALCIAILASAFFLSAIYGLLVGPKRDLRAGLLLGLLLGLAHGVSMGFGTYSAMPITLPLAIGWGLGAMVELVVGGAIVALVIGNSRTTKNA